MNVRKRKMRKKSKRQEISELLNKHNISTICVVDHKLVHTDETRYERIGELSIITTSAWRNSNNSSLGGIGIILNKKILASLFGIIKWIELIMIANFDVNPTTTIIIIHYTPYEGSKDAEDHYEQLTNATI